MIPSKKSDEMEAALTGMFGFDRCERIEANKCCPPPIGCGGPAVRFRDDLSAREFTISGLCQHCQDSVFSGLEPDEDSEPAWEPPAPPPEPPLVLGPNDWVSEGYSMFSGQADAAERRYHLYPCRNGEGGVWLVADQPNAGENVYYHNPANDATSQGFGGSTLHFTLTDGSIYAAKGPWHGGAEGVFRDTGIDVRDTYYTFVVLGMKREHVGSGYGRTVIRDVIYKDAAPTLGRFDRYKEFIRAYPQALVYYMSSKGGSSCGLIGESDRRLEQTT
jgi:hypothetical protein